MKFFYWLLISFFFQTTYGFQYKYLHGVSSCIAGSASSPQCFNHVSSFNGTIYSVYEQQTKLGQPEEDYEITAMGTAGEYMYAATSTTGIFKSLLKDGKNWDEVVSNAGSAVLCMTNAAQLNTPVFFGTAKGSVFKIEQNGTTTKIAQLGKAITAIAYDDSSHNVYIGTSVGKTYLYTESLTKLLELTGIAGSTEISSLSINSYSKVVIAAIGQKIYLLNIPGQKWTLIGQFPAPISSVLGVHNADFIYAATYNGHIYERDLSSSSSSWLDFGIPGGSMPISSLYGFDADMLGFINYDENVYSSSNGKFVYEGRLKDFNRQIFSVLF